MRQIYILLISAFIASSLSAQNDNPCGCTDQINFEPKLVGSALVLPQGISSHSFINSIAIPADIYLVTGDKNTNVNILYNGYLDEIIWQESKKFKMIQLDKDLIIGFQFKKFNNDTNVLFEKIRIKKDATFDSTSVFAQLFYKDNVSLYAYHTAYIYEAQKVTLGSKIYIKNIFRQKTNFYFQLPNNKTLGIKKIRKRHLFAIFPEKKAELTEKLKEFKQQRFRTREDLVQITKILSQLF